MGVAACLTATPRAHAKSLEMFELPVSVLRLLLSWDETHTISQPALHLAIEHVIVYFGGVLSTEFL